MVANQICKRESTTAELPMARCDVPAMEPKSFGGAQLRSTPKAGLGLADVLDSVGNLFGDLLGGWAVSPLLAFLASRSLISAAMTFCAASIPYVYSVYSVT